MSPGSMKGIAIGCFVLCAVLLYVAWDRYQDSAKAVSAANDFMNKTMGASSEKMGGAMGDMMKSMTTGARVLEPAWPDSTKYCVVFAVLCAIGGIACLVVGAKGAAAQPSPGAPPAR